MGPEAIAKYINPEEVVKRLAAAQGIDVLNLVKTQQQLQQEQQALQQQQMDQTIAEQAPNMAKAPVFDPSKNPQLAEQLAGATEGPPPPPQ